MPFSFQHMFIVCAIIVHGVRLKKEPLDAQLAVQSPGHGSTTHESNLVNAFGPGGDSRRGLAADAGEHVLELEGGGVVDGPVAPAGALSIDATMPGVNTRIGMDHANAFIMDEWGLESNSSWVYLKSVGDFRCVFRVKREEALVSLEERREDLVLKRVSLVEPCDELEFEREIQTMRMLDGQHSTLQLKSSYKIGQWGYILLPYVPHPDLLAYVQAARYLRWDGSSIWELFGMRAARQMSDTIVYMHSDSLIVGGLGHGDLKLDNILVSGLTQLHIDKLQSIPKDDSGPPPWMSELHRQSGSFRIAVQDLIDGRVPELFTLFDFGLSGPLNEQKEKRNRFTQKEVDIHMWSMSLLQLRHATDDLDGQMWYLNRRHFTTVSEDDDTPVFNPSQIFAFDDLISNLKDDTVDAHFFYGDTLDSHFKLLLQGTGATRFFAKILQAI